MSFTTESRTTSMNTGSRLVILIQRIPLCIHFGEHALPNGELTSTVARVMNKCIFLKELRFTTLIMEKTSQILIISPRWSRRAIGTS